MRKRFYIGVLPIHGQNVVVEAKNKTDVETEINKQIESLDKSYPDYDFHMNVRIYKGKRVK